MGFKARRREAVIAYTFLLPNLLGFLIFTSIPVLVSLALSFFDAQLAPWPQVLQAKFVGFGNFVKLMGFHMQNGAGVRREELASLPPAGYQFFNLIYPV